ncbi:MAG TPA: tachylectin-related carbohydrate-binding protein [Roseiarcus sp.]|jgi:hypothetical protein|nr:tachylectin-related carbohydrate-binding protein [Roseiarcus sp.]
MSFLAVTCDEASIFYAISDTGALLFYRDLARNGTANWANGGAASQIGNGWQGMRDIIAGGGGIIYAIDGAGQLLFYQDLARNGSVNWANGGAGQVISGGGWDAFQGVLGRRRRPVRDRRER